MAPAAHGFLWGASTAPHQVEGNNLNSDWWARETKMPGMEPSGDAVDSYHRYREDMELLAAAGLTAYRFGIEWSRIEPVPGRFSLAETAHYRRMIDTAIELGLAPVVTLQHFTVPRWFAEKGGWFAPDALEHWTRFVTHATSILGDVPYVITINEPNMLAFMITMMRRFERGELGDWQSPTVEAAGNEVPSVQAVLPPPDEESTARLIAAHHAVRDIVREQTDAAVGWSVANQALEALPGGEARCKHEYEVREDVFLRASIGDDFVGVQSYSAQSVDADGLVPHAPDARNTLVGTAYRPDALGIALRHTWEVTKGVPLLVTENGIATADDSRRIAYTDEALRAMGSAISDGVDVRGYLHWSLLDNYEWGHWGPTFGLIAVDRETFVRTPKPSLAWLGSVANRNALDHGANERNDD
jgi:beta-glucosidase